MLVEFGNLFFNSGHFFKLGAMGANVLVEFEKYFYLGAFLLKIGGIFFKIGGKNHMHVQKNGLLIVNFDF